LTPFAEFGDEFAGFAALANTLREEFDNDITPNWAANANARAAALQREYDGLLPYQQTGALGSFYRSQIHYLGEVAANPAPHLELTWTTRFNAFLPDDDDYNYITKDSVRPTCPFITDREGAKLWAQTSNAFDTVNIMGYDAAQFCDDGTGEVVAQLFDLNFERILKNFHEIGKIPKSKLMMGFGVGDQDAGASWEGMDVDIEAFKLLKQKKYGGGFIWAVNCDPDVTPNCAKVNGEAARHMNEQLQPVWPWGTVPTYSKCNPSTGWGPLSSIESFV